MEANRIDMGLQTADSAGGDGKGKGKSRQRLPPEERQLRAKPQVYNRGVSDFVLGAWRLGAVTGLGDGLG